MTISTVAPVGYQYGRYWLTISEQAVAESIARRSKQPVESIAWGLAQCIGRYVA